MEGFLRDLDKFADTTVELNLLQHNTERFEYLQNLTEIYITKKQIAHEKFQKESEKTNQLCDRIQFKQE